MYIHHNTYTGQLTTVVGLDLAGGRPRAQIKLGLTKSTINNA